MSVDIHALSGAYAVDAVDEFERAQFERHLADCDSCRAEVDSLRETAALIAETSAENPSDRVRQSVLAGIQNVRPLPPVVVAVAERGRSTRRRFPALVAAAAALIAFGGVGATVWHPWSDDDGGGQEIAAPRVEDAPDAETIVQELPDGGTVTVVRSVSLDQAVVSTDGLPQLFGDRTYQMWLVHDGRYVPAATMDGDASNVRLTGAADANALGITIEPGPGAERPNLDGTQIAIPLEQA